MIIKVILDPTAGTSRVVECTIFVRGLVRHNSLCYAASWTLTHEASGMSVLDRIPTSSDFLLGELLPLIRQIDFSKKFSDLISNEKTMELLQMAKSRIIGAAGERQVAHELRRMNVPVRSVPGSGNGPHRKCDKDAGNNIKIEVKSTTSDRYSLALAEFANKKREAAKEQRDLAYVIKFVGIVKASIVVMEARMLADLPEANLSLTATNIAVSIPAVMSNVLQTGKVVPVKDEAGEAILGLASFSTIRDLTTCEPT